MSVFTSASVNKKRAADAVAPTADFSFRKVCSEDGGVRHRHICFAPGGMIGAETRNNEGCFLSFPLLSILYIMGNKYAITERFRFEYSSEMNCLRKVSERLHNSDKGDSNIDGEKYRGCKNFHCTFSAFLHNIM